MLIGRFQDTLLDNLEDSLFGPRHILGLKQPLKEVCLFQFPTVRPSGLVIIAKDMKKEVFYLKWFDKSP